MDVSVVIPALNEAENVEPLAREIAAAMAPTGRRFEIIFVDDGSDDATPARVTALMADLPMLRLIRHARRYGQSAGVRTGVLAASGTWIATLDGDRQNDPADIPAMLALVEGANPPAMVAGERVKRRDPLEKRLASRFGNWIRNAMLKDGVRDTGCGLKLFRRDVYLLLPYFDHMHRFLPALVRRQGEQVVTAPVNHRPRPAGISKYGTLDRLAVGVTDLLGVWWLIRRSRFPVELVGEPAPAEPTPMVTDARA